MKLPHIAPGIGLAALIFIVPLSLSYKPPALGRAAVRRPELCEDTSCFANQSTLTSEASSCGDDETWDLGWYDGNGYNDYGSDYEPTACNPGEQISDPRDGELHYELCRNSGTLADPNWSCAIVSQNIIRPNRPSLSWDGCGDLTFHIYGVDNAGQGGTDPGDCSTIGCTTGDVFISVDEGEDFAGEGADCSLGGDGTSRPLRPL